MPHRRKLLISDDELIKLLDVSAGKARAIIRYLDRNHAATGFPQKQRIWNNRRYRPAVERWLDTSNPKRLIEWAD